MSVAQALAGDDVVAVDWAQVERQLTQRRPRRVLDLAVGLRLADGETIRLGIETKVDSSWSRAQLAESVSPPDRACLLAVGMTGLSVTEEDLASLPEGAARWNLVDAARWSDILNSTLEDRPGVVWAQYRAAVRQESDDLSLARAAVGRGADVTWGRHRELLGQWAFFAAVLDGLDGSGEWDRKKLISGPLVTNFVASASEVRGLDERHAGVFIELMAEGSRKSLCVKVYDNARPGQLYALQQAFAGTLPQTDFTPARAPSEMNSTCTVGRRVLPADAKPDEVREEVVRIQSHLVEVAPSTFRKALLADRAEDERS